MRNNFDDEQILAVKVAAQLVQVVAAINEEYPEIIEEYADEHIMYIMDGFVFRDVTNVPIPRVSTVRDTEEAVDFIFDELSAFTIQGLGYPTPSLIDDIISKGYQNNPSKLVKFACDWMELDDYEVVIEEGIRIVDIVRSVTRKAKISPAYKISDKYVIDLIHAI